MLIRLVPDRRRGASLVELAYVVAIASVILGIVWAKASDIYRDIRVETASQQLHSIAQTVRLLHPSGKIEEGESWAAYNLPADMTSHYQGRTIVFNPWRGAVLLLGGNAMGWGGDKYNDEFTVRFDGLPPEACADFIMENTSDALRHMGLVAFYISPEPGKGQEICFAQDSYCKNTITSVNADMIKHLCKAHNPMTVMFTYSLH